MITHRKRTPPQRARVDDQRGASAVEFALIFPVFLMLVFGGISSAAAYDRQNTLTHAAREGARYGATVPTQSTTTIPDAWFIDVASKAQEAANGHLASSIPGRYLCVAYVGVGSKQNSTTDRTRSRTVEGTSVTYANQPCYDDGRPTSERRVQVAVGRTTDFNVVFFAPSIDLTSEASARFEAVTT